MVWSALRIVSVNRRRTQALFFTRKIGGKNMNEGEAVIVNLEQNYIANSSNEVCCSYYAQD